MRCSACFLDMRARPRLVCSTVPVALTTGFRLGEKSFSAAAAMSGRRLSVRRIISVSSSDFPMNSLRASVRSRMQSTVISRP